MKRKSVIGNIAFYVCVALSCAPLVMLIILTVSTYWPYPSLLPEVVSAEYYSHVFLQNRQTLMAIVTSVLLAFFVVVLSLAIAVPAGKSGQL